MEEYKVHVIPLNVVLSFIADKLIKTASMYYFYSSVCSLSLVATVCPNMAPRGAVLRRAARARFHTGLEGEETSLTLPAAAVC